MHLMPGPLPRLLLELNLNLYTKCYFTHTGYWGSILPWSSCNAKSWFTGVKSSQIDIIFCYKIFNNLVAIEQSVAFQYRDTTVRHTRSSHTPNTLAKPFCPSTLLEQRVYTTIIDIWNSLPYNVTNSTTLQRFKKQLQLHNHKPFKIRCIIVTYFWRNSLSVCLFVINTYLKLCKPNHFIMFRVRILYFIIFIFSRFYCVPLVFLKSSYLRKGSG